MDRARGVRGVDVKAVSLDFTGFPELHLSCLLNLKRQDSYMVTCRGCILGLYLSPKISRVELTGWMYGYRLVRIVSILGCGSVFKSLALKMFIRNNVWYSAVNPRHYYWV